MKNNKETVLLLFSGGRDSFLSACLLIEQGYKVVMVTYENGLGLNSDNAKHGADRLIQRYGEDNIIYLGVINTHAIWRNFFLPYFNQTPSDIIKEYGEITISQFHCLTCRISMYIFSIIEAKRQNINLIADGARIDQGFVTELPIFINEIRDFFNSFDIKLLLPVWNLSSDLERKNSLLLRGFVPKTLEPQCLIGVPLPLGKKPKSEIQNGTMAFYKKVVLPKAQKLINTNMHTILNNTREYI